MPIHSPASGAEDILRTGRQVEVANKAAPIAWPELLRDHCSGFDDSVRGDRAERERARDPRLSLEARYASRDAWDARLAETVDRLVTERLLLAEDGDRLAIAARESLDVFREL
jgi:hypothetical protein